MLLYVSKFEYRSIYLHNFQVRCWGVGHRRENLLRKLLLEFCSYRLRSNHFEENQFMHPEKKSLEKPKTDESSKHYRQIHCLWLKIMTVQCTWCEERLCWYLHKFLLIQIHVCRKCDVTLVVHPSWYILPSLTLRLCTQVIQHLPCEFCLVWKTLFCY